MGHDEQTDKYFVIVDGVHQKDLDVKTITAFVSINGKIILGKTDLAGNPDPSPTEWWPSTVQRSLRWKIYDDNESITSIKVARVLKTKAFVMNELIGLLAIQQNI